MFLNFNFKLMVFNLKNIYYSPSCCGGTDFTPSRHHFPLDISKPGGGGDSHMKIQGMLVEKFELI